MAKGGISPSGRAVRFVLWRLPLGVSRYSTYRVMAAATVEGRHVLALVGFGLWVAAFWFAASWLHTTTGVVVPLRVAGLFGLLLIWRIVGLFRRWWVNRHQLIPSAVSLQRQRQMDQKVTQTLKQVRQLPAVLGRGGDGGGGGVDVLGKLKGFPEDPVTQEFRQRRRDQSDEVRGYLPEEHQGMPLGQEFEPMVRPPRWMQRRWRRQEKKGGQ